MKFFKLICALSIGLTTNYYGVAQNKELSQFIIDGQTQGTTYYIKYYSTNEDVKKHEIDSLLNIIDNSMSLYKENTLIDIFNKLGQGDYIIMDELFKEVMEEAYRVNRLSDGIFDITIQPLTDLWGFSTKTRRGIPTKREVDSVRRFVGMDKVKISGDTLFKKYSHVKLDLDGIVPGYTADYLSSTFRKRGINSFTIEIGGEIFTSGRKPNGARMQIAISRPLGDQDPLIVKLEDKAIITSGSYEHYKEYRGQRYSHHIDPRTGYPARHYSVSATLIGPNTAIADALGNVCMLLKPEEAVGFISELEDYELYLLYIEDESLESTQSPGFKKFIVN